MSKIRSYVNYLQIRTLRGFIIFQLTEILLLAALVYILIRGGIL